jgi:hypothetical protein
MCGLATRSHSGLFLLPPFALWTTFSSSLVGRGSHDSLWWLCHHLTRERSVIPWYVVVIRTSYPLEPRLIP